MKYLIANWKAHKSLKDSESWISSFRQLLSEHAELLQKLESKHVAIIIAPSSPHIALVKNSIKELPNCFVAAQAVSFDKEGDFTGEVTAAAVKDMVTYALVGHSERRHMGETPDRINKQLLNLKESSIAPILCIRSAEELPQDYNGIVAYEPSGAIASHNNAPVDEVMEVYKKIALSHDSVYLYGGSVNGINCKEYTAKEEIKGFIVGTASLEPEEFMSIVACL